MANNYYDILGVNRDASADEIKKAFKKAALTHHPDKGGDPEKFKECSAAVETLTDERKRAAYDSQLLRSGSLDGWRSSADHARSSSGTRQANADGGLGSRMPSHSRPPRPPGPTAPVEIPADPSSLSIKELKELLTALGIDHEGCLEKADLLALVKARKDKRSGTGDATPRAGAPSGAPFGASSQAEKPSTPRAEQAGRAPSPSFSASASSSAPAPTGPVPRPPKALRIKVMSLGSGAVGKSTLIKRYCEGRFVQKYITTIGIDYGVKQVKISGQDVKVNFFDTSGGDEFKDIRLEFYEMGQTSGVLLVFDVTNPRSFADLDDWLDEAQRHKCPLSKLHRAGSEGSPVVVLCANKTDLPKRCVSKTDGAQFAARHGMYYYETSASSGDSVVEAMNCLFERIVRNVLEARKSLGAG